MIAEATSVPAAGGKAYQQLAQIVRERGWLEKAPGRALTIKSFEAGALTVAPLCMLNSPVIQN